MSKGSSSVKRLEGLRVGDEPIGVPEKCDTCGKPVTAGGVIGVYLTNTPLVNEVSTPHPFRIHCSGCETSELHWSATGFGELLVVAKIGEEKELSNVHARDYSSEEDGIPYDPVEVFAKLIDFPKDFVKYEVIPEEDLAAPQDFMYYMMLNGMDPRDAIDMDTGEVTTNEINQTRFFETVFMQFEEGLSGSLGGQSDTVLSGTEENSGYW